MEGRMEEGERGGKEEEEGRDELRRGNGERVAVIIDGVVECRSWKQWGRTMTHSALTLLP